VIRETVPQRADRLDESRGKGERAPPNAADFRSIEEELSIVNNSSYQPSFGQQGIGQQSFGQQQYGGGQSVPSQYRGLQKQYQPTGAVQSFYQPQQTTSYHTANYIGSQPNHDASLRADSVNPSTFRGGFQSNQSSQMSPVSQSIQPQGVSMSYHTANYIGNQPNHDASLRADSVNPSSFGGMTGQSQVQGMQGTSYHTASYVGNQPNHDASLRADSVNPSSFGMTGQAQGGSFHTASYIGNQPNHDASLRADSVNPSSFTAVRSSGFQTGRSQVGQAQSSFGSFRNF